MYVSYSTSLRLSLNWTLAELVKTNCGLSNVPSMEQILNLHYGVVMILQPLRDYIGCPLICNSAFRSAEVNKAVGGVSNSQHLSGCAADIRVPEGKKMQFWDFLSKCKYVDQALGGRSFVHVSWSPFRQPRQCYDINYYNY